MQTNEQSHGRFVVYASEAGAKLDSNVITGGGTDDTAILQSILDRAPELGGLHLVMDGAALIRGLRIHSNTTIECLNKACGFYLADQSNCAVVRNYHRNFVERVDENITLLGGTYNQNCKNQLHDRARVDEEGEDFRLLGTDDKCFGDNEWMMCFQFYGITHLTVRDVTIRNQRTFSSLVANFEHVVMENIIIDLPDKMYAQNQDGLHFWGPGRFLSLKNISGDVGDDFIALAPDEHDCVSNITDVLIDGVFLQEADQGIRMLSRGTGRLDRVTIKNVTGTYRSFGFYINPWFPGDTIGNFGNIVLDNIDMRPIEPVYDYTESFLFRIGGKIDSLTLRNISHIDPRDNRPLMQAGIPFYEALQEGESAKYNHIRKLTIDGLNILENNPASSDADYFQINCPVDCMVVRDTEVVRSPEMECKGSLVKFGKEADVKTLFVHGLVANGLENVFKGVEGCVDTCKFSDILCDAQSKIISQSNLAKHLSK